jgi:phosphoribosylanthranilate isomerase
MRVKICGITQAEQGRSIAQLGASALGFICFPKSPRYVTPSQIRSVVDHLPIQPSTKQRVDRIGVFVNAELAEICQTVAIGSLTGVQLHGSETPEFCQQLRAALPEIEIIRALRIKTPECLAQVEVYEKWVNTFLLDAYHPNLLGGTGRTIDWSVLHQFRPQKPWLLAGGLKPDNVLNALQQIQPDGIDLSSGVEIAPGNKDLNKVAQLFTKLQEFAGTYEPVPAEETGFLWRNPVS